MSEPSSSLSPPQNRARASSTSRRPPLTLNTCSSRKRGSSFSDADFPSPDSPTSGIPPSENRQTMALPSLFSRSLQVLDLVRFTHPSPTPSTPTDESLLPTMAPSPTLSTFTDSVKEKDSSYTTRSPSVCTELKAKLIDRVANRSLSLLDAPPHCFRYHPLPALNVPGGAFFGVFTGNRVVATDTGGFGLNGQGPTCIFPKWNMAVGTCHRCSIYLRCLETCMVGAG